MNDKIEGLLAAGRALLASGRPREAAFAFERVLLLVPADQSARAGLDSAQAATAEYDRSIEERLAAVDRPRRIPSPRGWFALRRAEGDLAPELAAGTPSGRSRMVLGALCAVLFLLLGAAIAGNWNGLMRSLAQAPVPHETSLTLAAHPVLRADDQTIATARQGSRR